MVYIRRGKPPRSISAASRNTRSAKDRVGLAGNSTSEPDTRAFDFECPLCDKVKGHANISERTGEWVVSCWSCTESTYLFDLGSALKIPRIAGGGWALKEDARKWLAPYITREVSKPKEPDPLPTPAEIAEWCEMLHAESRAYAYLLRERGLNPRIIRKCALGYDGRAITIPILDPKTRELVNLRRRYWPRLPTVSGTLVKYKALAGRTLENGGVTVYPGLPPDGPLILCEGEFDALLLRCHRLPSITVTSGMGTRWRQEWSWMVEDRKVAVMFDAGQRSEQQAISRAVELRRDGADAWPVRLSKAGLKDGEDATDWFVKYRRTSDALKDFINHEYRSAP